MLRAIFRRRMRDAISGCQVDNQLFSFRVDVPTIERELRKGGFGEAGFEAVELVGMEIEEPEDNPYKDSMFVKGPEKVEGDEPECPACHRIHKMMKSLRFTKIDCECGCRFTAERKQVIVSAMCEYRE